MEYASQIALNLQCLEDAAAAFVPCRHNTVKVLKELAEYLIKHHANAQKAKVAGSTAGIVGSGLIIGGFVTSFFTCGFSLVLSGIGAGIGAAGGLTTVGGLATEGMTSHITKKSVEEVLKADSAAFRGFKDAVRSLESALEDMSAAVIGVRSVTVVGHGIGIVGGMVKAGVQAANMGKAAGQGAFRTATALGRGFAIAGVAFSLVAVPFDVYTLVTSVSNIENNKVPEMAQKIQTIAEELTCPSSEEMNRFVLQVRRQFNSHLNEFYFTERSTQERPN